MNLIKKIKSFFERNFSFEHGVDLNDEVEVLFRRNIVIKNIICNEATVSWGVSAVSKVSPTLGIAIGSALLIEKPNIKTIINKSATFFFISFIPL